MDVPVNPVLATLGANVSPGDVTTLRGYVGPSTSDDRIKLYASLDDLTNSVEIAKDDILHFAELPESILPLGAVTIWLKKRAEVTFSHTEKNAVAAEATFEKTPVEINRGRLRMLVRAPLFRQAAADSVCVIPCDGDSQPPRCDSKPTCEARRAFRFNVR
jgi:hypothetical protein